LRSRYENLYAYTAPDQMVAIATSEAMPEAFRNDSSGSAEPVERRINRQLMPFAEAQRGD